MNSRRSRRARNPWASPPATRGARRGRSAAGRQSSPASTSGCTAQRASARHPSPAFTSSVIASVNCTSSIRAGETPGRQQHLLQHAALLPRRVDEQRLVAQSLRPDVRLLCEADGAARRSARPRPRTAVFDTSRRSRTGALTIARSSLPASSISIGARVAVDVDPHFDARELAAVAHQQRRQPVVAGVALGGDPQHAGVLLAHPADVLFGLRQTLEDVFRRRQQPLARRRQHQPLADAEEQRRAEARFDVAQLVAERRLRQVQPSPARVRLPISATAATSCRCRTSRSMRI